MPPYWLEIIAIASLVATLVSIVLIALDVANANPQRMRIMNFVWPVTPLYLGPLALWAYRAGESSAEATPDMAYAGGRPSATRRKRQFSQIVLIAAARSAGACALGVALGEWILFRVAPGVADEAPWTSCLLDLVLAGLLGILFQYGAMASRRQLRLGDGVAEAAREDWVVLLGCLLGFFGWMAISRLLLFPQLSVVHWSYWLMLQIGLLLGFATSYLMSWWRIRSGVKEAI